MEEKEVEERMMEESLRLFNQGIQKWQKRNPNKEINEIPKETVIAVLLNTAIKTIHPRTVRSDIPVNLAKEIHLCVIDGKGLKDAINKIYEDMTKPVDWTSYRIGVLAY
ncbi:MAG: hypothetical protein PHR47_02795 [Candidatus Pacebacteria bacterium]|nr:hypothetical protein [Candidatus Paceibacterota bacterium]